MTEYTCCIYSSPRDSDCSPKEGIGGSKRFAQVLTLILLGIQANAPPADARNTEVTELQRKLDIAEDDIALINRRLDNSQGVYFKHSLHQCACNLSLTLKRVFYMKCA